MVSKFLSQKKISLLHLWCIHQKRSLQIRCDIKGHAAQILKSQENVVFLAEWYSPLPFIPYCLCLRCPGISSFIDRPTSGFFFLYRGLKLFKDAHAAVGNWLLLHQKRARAWLIVTFLLPPCHLHSALIWWEQSWTLSLLSPQSLCYPGIFRWPEGDTAAEIQARA